MLIEVIDRIYRLLWGVVSFDFSGKSSELISAIVVAKVIGITSIWRI